NHKLKRRSGRQIGFRRRERDGNFDRHRSIGQRGAPGIVPIRAVVIGKLKALHVPDQYLLIGRGGIKRKQVAGDAADQVLAGGGHLVGGVLQRIIDLLDWPPRRVAVDKSSGGKNLERRR